MLVLKRFGFQGRILPVTLLLAISVHMRAIGVKFCHAYENTLA